LIPCGTHHSFSTFDDGFRFRLRARATADKSLNLSYRPFNRHHRACPGGTPEAERERLPGALPYTALPGGSGHRSVRLVQPVREVLAALAPGRVLPFAPGGSRKHGPRPRRRGGAPRGERAPSLTPPPQAGRQVRRARAARQTGFAHTEQTGLRCGFPVDALAGAPPPFFCA